MTDDPSRRQGTVKAPRRKVSARQRRQEQEAAEIAAVEERLRAGMISGEQADDELLEVVLKRFSYLKPDQIAELRAFGRELNDEPEMVETRLTPDELRQLSHEQAHDDEETQP